MLNMTNQANNSSILSNKEQQHIQNQPKAKVSKKRKRVIGALFGTIVEYYDYSLYGFSAAILAEKFFPNYDRLTGLMYVFLAYAAAYVMKPFGALFFSRIGDFMGRKASLRITILGIAFPTMTIGLVPDYSEMGSISTAILVVCRLLQGFFTAGEYDGAAIYVIEHFGEKQHYTASTLTRSVGVAGLLLGIISTNFFNSSVMTSIFEDFAWRIPFLISVPLAMLTIHFRRHLEETPDFTAAVSSPDLIRTGTLKFIKTEWRKLFLIAMLAGGFGVTYQVVVIFMKQYLPIVSSASTPIITTISIAIVFIFGVFMPLSGILADRFGHMLVVRGSLISTILFSVLFYISIQLDFLNLTLISALALAISVAPFNGLAHGAIVKAFPTTQRYRGVSIGHTFGSMVMSGSANAVCLYFMNQYDLIYFPIIYVGIFSAIAYMSFKKLSENK